MLQRNADSNNYQPSVARTRIKSRALAKGRRQAEVRLRTLSSAAVEEADDRTNSSKKPVDRKCQCAETDDNGQPKIQPEATVRCELIHKHGFGCRFLSALMQHIGEFFDVEMPAGGMQLVAWCRDGMDDRGLADRLSQAAVVARPVSSMFFRTPARRSYFLAPPRGVRTRSIAR